MILLFHRVCVQDEISEQVSISGAEGVVRTSLLPINRLVCVGIRRIFIMIKLQTFCFHFFFFILSLTEMLYSSRIVPLFHPHDNNLKYFPPRKLSDFFFYTISCSPLERCQCRKNIFLLSKGNARF